MTSLAAFRRKPAVQDATSLRLLKIKRLYSRISLESLALKLKLANAEAAESLCCEMIHDGRLVARIDQLTQSITFEDEDNAASTSDNSSSLHQFDKSIQQLCARIVYCADRINDNAASATTAAK